MSWLSGIAGRAEALLDRMDQAAATSLQGTGIGTSPVARSHVGTPKIGSSLSYEPTASLGAELAPNLPTKSSSILGSKTRTTTPTYSPVSHPGAPPRTSPTPSSYQAFSKSRASAPNDSSIFEFLNSPSKEGVQHKSKSLTRRPTPKKHGHFVAPPSSTKAQFSADRESSNGREGGKAGEGDQEKAAEGDREEVDSSDGVGQHSEGGGDETEVSFAGVAVMEGATVHSQLVGTGFPGIEKLEVTGLEGATVQPQSGVTNLEGAAFQPQSGVTKLEGATIQPQPGSRVQEETTKPEEDDPAVTTPTASSPPSEHSQQLVR